MCYLENPQLSFENNANQVEIAVEGGIPVLVYLAWNSTGKEQDNAKNECENCQKYPSNL